MPRGRSRTAQPGVGGSMRMDLCTALSLSCRRSWAGRMGTESSQLVTSTSCMGTGSTGGTYWASRYATVFARMAALGFTFVGPQAIAGRRADPWPDELPRDSNNVPTYHTNRQSPASATRQLDFTFASNGFAQVIRATALNEPEQWGPSDHCRIEIEIT